MRRASFYAAGIAGVVLIGAAAINASLGVRSRGTGVDGPPVEGVATAPASRCSCGGSCGEIGSLPLAGTGLGNAAHAFDDAARRKGEAGDVYFCPMHPQFASRIPGMCPACGAMLVRMPVRASTGAACHCPSCPFRPRAEGPFSARSTVSR
jgi:hypothetical protein